MEIKYSDKVEVADKAYSVMLFNVLTPGAVCMMPLGFELPDKEYLDILMTLAAMNKDSFVSRCTAIIDKYETKNPVIVAEFCIGQILYAMYGRGIAFKFKHY
jgi:hypothetical protein